MIKVVFLNKYPVICEAFTSWMDDVEDVKVVGCTSNYDELFKFLILNEAHIVVSVLYNLDPSDIDYTRKIVQRFIKVKVLVLTLYKNELGEIIFSLYLDCFLPIFFFEIRNAK